MGELMRVRNRKEITLGGYGSVYIEEDFSGGYKILIDTHGSENIWLGFKEPGVTHYIYWNVVQRWNREKMANG